MKRRDFLRKGIGAGVLAGSALSMVPYHRIAGKPAGQDGNFDLVAIKGGEPHTMFDQAIQAMGGIKKYVKPNQKVVVKPNIGWDSSPEKAADTNPRLVGRIVEHCLTAGAKEVYVFDHTCNAWTKCYKNSGIEKAVKDAGGKIVPGNSKNYFHEVELENAKILKKVMMHELVLDSDVFINVPVLKNHGGATMTITMKNLMGIVWDRRFWHSNGLHECIAEFASFRQPDLNVVDAYRVMKRNGPRGVSVSDSVLMKSQIISEDMVASDVAASKIWGIDPMDVGHIRMASEMGVGESDLTKLNIKRIKV